jgi:acetolactate synthase-1/2/3 large subunit
MTAAQEGLGIPIVVANNGGYGEIRRQQLELGHSPLGVDLVAPDIPALAEAMGCAGVRAESPDAVAAAVERSFAESRPTVIEWPC